MHSNVGQNTTKELVTKDYLIDLGRERGARGQAGGGRREGVAAAGGRCCCGRGCRRGNRGGGWCWVGSRRGHWRRRCSAADAGHRQLTCTAMLGVHQLSAGSQAQRQV